MVVIKQVLEYEFNYAEYEITDGEHSLICMCLSVPLQNGKEPQIGMEIEQLYAFCHGDTINLETESCKKFNVQKAEGYFAYRLSGIVVDSRKAIIKIFGFSISLEFYYPNGFGEMIKMGDCVTFFVDRVDCILAENIQ